MKRPMISLCMIVKNEAEHLEGALASVKELVDDVVVVDTGSTDGTNDIARSLGALVHEAPWQNDFSAARNASISRATGDWILILDADERIAAEDHCRLRNLVSPTGSSAAYLLPQRTYMWDAATVGWKPNDGGYAEAGSYPGYIENHQVRLFPRLPGLCYQGAVHESLEASCAGLSLPLSVAAIPVHHFGKVRSRDYLLRKAALYLELGIRKLSSTDADVKAAFELAVQLAELDCPSEARQILEAIIDLAPRHVGARNMLGVMLTRLGETDAALRELHQAVEHEPGFADAWNNLGIVYLHDDRPGDAATSLEKAVLCDPANANAWGNLAIARAEKGEFEGALEAARTARSLGTNLGKARLLEIVVREKSGDVAAARALLEAALSDQVYLTPADIFNFFQLSHQLGVMPDSESFLNSQFEVVSNDRDRALQLAQFLDCNGCESSAGRLLRLVEARYPAWAPASNMIGYILAKKGKYADALDSFTAAVEKDPSNTDYVKNVALACERLGITKKALVLYQHLASMSPGCIAYARERILSLQRMTQADDRPPQFVKVHEESDR